MAKFLKAAFAIVVILPIVFLWEKIIFQLLLKIFALYTSARLKTQKFWAPAKNKTVYILIRRTSIGFVVLLLAFYTFYKNVKSKNIDNERLNENTIIVELAQGNDVYFYEEFFIEKAVKTNVGNFLSVKDVKKKQKLKEEEITSVTELAIGKQPVTGDMSSIAERTKAEEYTVEGGDTISGIGTKFGLKTSTILWANKMSAGGYIKPGQKLTIPPVDGIMHTVAKDESLDKIAKKYSADKEKIITYNKLASEDMIKKGDSLMIPGGEMPETISKKAYASGSSWSPSVSKRLPKFAKSIAPGSGLYWPTVSHKIARGYAYYHKATDHDGNSGDPIFGAQGGKVVHVATGYAGGYGGHVIVDHGSGLSTLYAHMRNIYVKSGQSISKGEVLGEMGGGRGDRWRGRSTGSHLHFEVRQNGAKQNPMRYY